MGQKVDPRAFRLGILRGWSSLWFSNKNKYGDHLVNDLKIRRLLEKRLRTAGVAKIEIDRQPGGVSIMLYSSRPGIIIGRGGAGIEELRKDLGKLMPPNTKVSVDVHEIRQPEKHAALIAQQVAEQLEKRISFRRILKKTIERVMATPGVQGVKIQVSGRLDGADMSRREWLSDGKIPLHTIRADIDYARATAFTTYSAIGVQVWLYRGDVLQTDDAMERERRERDRARSSRRGNGRPGGRNAAGRGARRSAPAGAEAKPVAK